MNILYLGGQTAGLIGFLTLRSLGHTVSHVVAYDWGVGDAAFSQGATVCPRLSGLTHGDYLNADLLVCVHGREIVPTEFLKLPKYGGINLHPCLWKYKGAHPVERAVDAGEPRISVGVHRMTADVDTGQVLWERFIPMPQKPTVHSIYQELYPLYVQGITHGIQELLRGELAELERATDARNRQFSDVSRISKARS